MSTYFIRKSGSNANAGTSAGAAWLTIGKALASGTAAGDTIYVGAGTYREQVTVGVAGSSGSPISLIGDVDGAQTGDAGDVVWTSYTTNDTTAPAGAATCQVGVQTWLTFQNLVIIGGTGSGGNNGACVDNNTGIGNDGLVWRDCVFATVTAGANSIALWVKASASTITFDRCVWYHMGSSTASSNGAALFIYVPVGAADWNWGLTLTNCLLLLGGNCYGIKVDGAGGSGTGHAGGGSIRNCSIFGGVYGVIISTANFQTATQLTVANCYLVSNSGTDLSANTSGQIVENYNVLQGQTARSNVTAGANSKTGNSVAPLLSLGQEGFLGRHTRAFLSPLVTRKAGVVDVISPLLGFGSDGSGPSVDYRNRPRPSGGQSTGLSVGYLERHDEGQQESTITDGGTGSSLKLVGPCDHELRIPVDAVSTTITVKYRSDANAAPTAQVLANGEIGVSASSVQTGSTSQGTFTTLTIPAFTPSAKGWVTLRLASGATTGTGVGYFDTVGVS